MINVNHFIDGTQSLPASVWSQTNDFNIYRGNPLTDDTGNGW